MKISVSTCEPKFNSGNIVEATEKRKLAVRLKFENSEDNSVFEARLSVNEVSELCKNITKALYEVEECYELYDKIKK